MFTDPKKNIESFGLLPGLAVADLGAGAGFYALPLAEKVGPTGRVYAVDCHQDLLLKISREASERRLANLEIVWGDLEKPGGSRLADQTVDVALAADVLFALTNRRNFAAEIRRILKLDKGRLYVLEWQDSFGGLGPEPQMVVQASACRELFTAAGLIWERELPAVGAHHYGLMFRKK